jgi:hypothetical protein
MADEKKKGASALYDNPRSKSRDKEAAATAEADMAAGDTPKADGAGSADAGVKKVVKASEKFLKAIKEVRGRHETERRDFHGTVKDQLRAMAERHDTEIGGLLDQIGVDDDEGDEMEMAAAAAEGAEA